MAIQVFKDLSGFALSFGVFDFDNGIVDTESVFAEFDCALLNGVLVRAGLQADLQVDFVRSLAGHNGAEKLEIIAERYGFDAASFMDDYNAERTARRRNLFIENPAEKAQGLDDFLVHIGDKRALATNKKSTKLLPDMEAMGIAGMFDVVVTSDDLPRKPAPDVILAAMEALGAVPHECAYFGDNVRDIEAALAADVCAVGIILEGLEGHEDRARAMKDAGAHAVTDDYRDMIPYFSV